MHSKKVKTDTKKKYYYHLTDQQLEEDDNGNVFLLPMNGINRADDEPSGNRICVSTTPEGCFVAIPVWSGYDHFLYRTVNKITAKIPYDVGDAKVTGERWILGKRKFKRVLAVETDSIISPYQCKNSLISRICGIINQNYFDLGSGEEKHIKNQMICKKLIGKLPEIKQLKESEK